MCSVRTHLSIGSRCSKHNETVPQFDDMVYDAPFRIPQSTWYLRLQNFNTASFPTSRQQPIFAPTRLQYAHVWEKMLQFCQMQMHNVKCDLKKLPKIWHVFPRCVIPLGVRSISSGFTGLKITQLKCAATPFVSMNVPNILASCIDLEQISQFFARASRFFGIFCFFFEHN